MARISWSILPPSLSAAQQDISLKYLVKILPVLVKNGIITGGQGKSGGYRLSREPEAYTLGEILRLTEGSLAPVACLECGAAPCEGAVQCKTLPIWTQLDRLVNNYLDSVTLADLLQK